MSLLRCLAPAGSGVGVLVVTVGDAFDTSPFAYSAPVVIALSKTLVTAFETEVLVVYGRNLANKMGSVEPVVRTGASGRVSRAS